MNSLKKLSAWADTARLTFTDSEGRLDLQPLRHFAIHLITAAGAGCALLAMMAAADHHWSDMFAWLAAALFLDAIDGPMARYVKLWDALPRWSGEILDLVVDFVTYVFVPAYAITVSGLLPHGFAILSGVAIVVTSAIYFADTEMKLADNYFKGFPAIWNAAAFYFFLIAPPPLLALLYVAALIVMMFLPIPFIHPVRVVRMRSFNMVVLAVWSGLAVIAMMHDMAAGPIVTGALCVIGLYIIGGGLLRRRPA
jgi:phosphatidylcholine synthase